MGFGNTRKKSGEIVQFNWGFKNSAVGISEQNPTTPSNFLPRISGIESLVGANDNNV